MNEYEELQKQLEAMKDFIKDTNVLLISMKAFMKSIKPNGWNMACTMENLDNRIRNTLDNSRKITTCDTGREKYYDQQKIYV